MPTRNSRSPRASFVAKDARRSHAHRLLPLTSPASPHPSRASGALNQLVNRPSRGHAGPLLPCMPMAFPSSSRPRPRFAGHVGAIHVPMSLVISYRHERRRAVGAAMPTFSRLTAAGVCRQADMVLCSFEPFSAPAARPGFVNSANECQELPALH